MSAILELDIVLKGSKPKIWRRVWVPETMTFHKLHYVIQFAMEWENCHLYRFIKGRFVHVVGIPHPDEFDRMEDSRKLPISAILVAPKDNINYIYDFGDRWEHTVTVKKILPPDPGQTYPWLVGGAKAAPPEDCGGIWSYAGILETLKDKSSKQYKELLEWLGDEFDPEFFDKHTLNTECFEHFEEEIAAEDRYMGY
jgi:hypothetical protein